MPTTMPFLAAWMTAITMAGSSAPLPVADEAALRKALRQAADAEEAVTILLAPGTRITPTAPLVYRGRAPLVIDGRGAEIDGRRLPSAGGAATGGDLRAVLLFRTAAPVTLRNLTVRHSPAGGIALVVPAGARGLIGMTLEHVTIAHTAGHGLHLDDNWAREDDGDNGSVAGIRLVMRGCRIRKAGIGGPDFDGLRIDERGAGAVTALLEDVAVVEAGGDGIEIDEGGPGSVVVQARGVQLADNGSRDPEDLEDGFDIDEAGPGDVVFRFSDAEVLNSRDEGLDLDEAGPGDLVVTLDQVRVESTRQEGIKLDEDQAGNITLALRDVTVSDGRDDGVKVTEKGKGRITGSLVRVTVSDNLGTGLVARQQGGGRRGLLKVDGLLLTRNAGAPTPDLAGVDMR